MNGFAFHAEVREALNRGLPVVALESTVITHGLPAPVNLDTARAMEAEVRNVGAVPATIAILDGKVVIGCSEDELVRLAEAPAGTVRKCSPRDLPLVLAEGGHGSTTVAATLVLARRAGIAVFATGGIGGVHRGGAWDVSADLEALRDHPLTVVCSGAKAILDLPATREVLETHGVTVLGVGTDTVPAFYVRHSALPVDLRVETPSDAVEVIRHRDRLGMPQAVLVTVPVPEADALDPGIADEAIETALAEAEANGIRGREVTPYLLAAVSRVTGNHSRAANIALLRNNARVAASIAVELAHPPGDAAASA